MIWQIQNFPVLQCAVVRLCLCLVLLYEVIYSEWWVSRCRTQLLIKSPLRHQLDLTNFFLPFMYTVYRLSLFFSFCLHFPLLPSFAFSHVVIPYSSIYHSPSLSPYLSPSLSTPLPLPLPITLHSPPSSLSTALSPFTIPPLTLHCSTLHLLHFAHFSLSVHLPLSVVPIFVPPMRFNLLAHTWCSVLDLTIKIYTVFRGEPRV